MAIGTPTVVGTLSDASTSEPHTLTLSAAVAVGDVLIVATLEAGGRTLVGVSDSQSNPGWQIDETLANTTNHGGGVASVVVTNALSIGDTLSLDFSSTGVCRAVAFSVSGLDTTSRTDISVSQANASSATLTSPTGGTSDTADELQIGVGMHGASSASLTPETLSPVWTHLDSGSTSGTVRTLRVYYRIVSATEAQRFRGTLSSAQVNTGFFVTYRGAAASGAALAGAIDAAAALAGNVETDKPLAGTIDAAATLAGDLTIAAPAVLDGGIDATGVFAGDLTINPAASFGGTIAAAGALAGDLTTAVGASLAGVIAATATLSAVFEGSQSLPPVPAVGQTFIEVLAPAPGFAAWGAAEPDWGDAAADWVGLTWQDVTPESMNVQIAWGASKANGILSNAVAGPFTIKTYDPGRVLDPSNPDSHLATVLHAGTPIRVRFEGTSISRVVRKGTIDVIEYSLDTKLGKVEAIDGIARAVAAKVASTYPPSTLTRRAEWAVHEAGLDIGVDILLPLSDPVVGVTPLDADKSAWQWIDTSALDVLYAVWLDHDNTFRFRDWLSPVDNGLTLGGAVGIPMDDLRIVSSAEGLYARVIAFDELDPEVPQTSKSGDAYALVGDAAYKRTRPVPSGLAWAQAVVADRGRITTQYLPGKLRPKTEDQLAALIDAGMAETVSIVVNAVDPQIVVDAIVVGGTLEADTRAGWSGTLLTYVPPE